MPMEYKIYFDGACDNNSKLKLMGAGVAVYVNCEHLPQHDIAECVGTNGTSNIAEFEALTLAVQLAEKLLASGTVKIYGDSQVVIHGLNGFKQVQADHLKEYMADIVPKINFLKSRGLKGIYWIPREQNKQADILSKKGITDFVNG